jgi:iron-sulfur cluster assembly protein
MNETTFPFTIEPSALDEFRKILAKSGAEGGFVRVGIKGGGCSGFEYLFKVDTTVREGDFILETDGLMIHCDPKSAKFLEGATLKFTGNMLGAKFQFENPNAQRSCGCGTSFTPKSL